MWSSRLFGSLPILLDFVNNAGLTHDQFKIAIVPPRIWQRRANPRYYLIYRATESEAAEPAALAATATGGAIEREAAVDTATRIIADALTHGEGPER